MYAFPVQQTCNAFLAKCFKGVHIMLIVRQQAHQSDMSKHMGDVNEAIC